jgi:hypothetical protein
VRVRSILIPSLVAALALSACLADLPAATQCPPVAKHVASDCKPALLQGGAAPGCAIDPTTVSCLTGSRASCECGANECPTDRGACFPAGDCPRFVTDSVRGSVTCLHLAPEAIVGGTSSCTCGCAACASTCDGMGPVIATHLASTNPAPALRVDNLNLLLPASGKIGLYLRVRGFVTGDSPGVAIFPSAPGAPAFSKGIAPTSESQFTDVLAYDPATSLSWTTAEDRPTQLALFTQQGASILEVDCIVPFVVATP